MQAVILAAGASSRFWPVNGRHKCLLKIAGKPTILALIESIKDEGIKEVIIVQGSGKEVEKELAAYKSPLPIKYVVQSSPKGTGDAILKTQKLIKDQFFVFNAERIDAGECISPILKKYKKEKTKLIILAGETDTPWLYGILKVEKDKVIDLIEKPEPGKEPSNLKVVGTYFLPKEFFNYLKKAKPGPYSLEDALLMYAKDEETEIVNINKKTFSLKYPWHLLELKNYVFDNFLENKISRTAEIEKSVEIEGDVFIGENVRILKGAKIKGPCYIGDNSFIGNNALVRDYSNIEKGSVIGAYAEVTRSIFQERVKVHSGYFGDSIIGKECFIGAGVITANIRLDEGKIRAIIKGQDVKTGLNKLGSIIGQKTRIGINCSLMPGVMIGADCNIGPHSIVLNNIGDGITYYSKSEGVIK